MRARWLSLSTETKQSIGFVAGLAGITVVTLVWIFTDRLNPTLLLLFGGMAGFSITVPKGGP